MSKISVMKYRALASFAKDPAWTEVLKPKLIELKNQVAESEVDANTLEQAAIRDIKRSTSNKTINEIIRFVERAHKKVKIK